MKVMIITHNFPPDLGAASFRFESLVKALIKEKNTVEVLTSLPNRINEFNLERDEIKIKGLKVNRFNSSKLKTNIIGVAFNYIEFFIKALMQGRKIAKRSDIIIASSPQLLIGVVGALISKITRKTFILEIRDLWPDFIVEMGAMGKYNPIYLFLKLLENFMYKESDAIVYNSPAFETYLRKKNLNKKMKLLTNGLDNSVIEELKGLKCKNKDKLMLTYAGNLGKAQNLETLLEIAASFKEKIEFTLIGKGSDQEKLLKIIQDKELNNVHIVQPVPRKELFKYYGKSDILYLQLKNIEMLKKVIPSKIFEYVATGKPIIYGIEGVGKKILEDLNCRYNYSPENVDELTKVLNKVLNDIKLKKVPQNNIKKLKNNYSREEISKNYTKFIQEVKDASK